MDEVTRARLAALGEQLASSPALIGAARSILAPIEDRIQQEYAHAVAAVLALGTNQARVLEHLATTGDSPQWLRVRLLRGELTELWDRPV